MYKVTRVDEGVFLHVGLLVESLAAVLAGVRPRVRVDQQVCGQSGRPLEAFPTDFTAENPLLSINTHTHQPTVSGSLSPGSSRI